MDWGAFTAIGLFTVALGILLFVPARIWAKRKRRADSHSYPKLKLTRTGWVLSCITIGVLIGGFMTQFLTPDSLLGQFVKTSSGRFLYAMVLLLVFWLIEAALSALGIQLIDKDTSSRRPKDGEKPSS